MLKIIVACDNNRIIGADNKMPWRLPTDLKRFKEKTTGGIVVMGANTFESLDYKPLPNRKNIILSRSLTPQHAVYSFNDKEDVIYTKNTDLIVKSITFRDLWIIGGQSIYEQFIDMADEIHMTHVHADLEGDTFFPSIDYTEWEEVETVFQPRTEKDSHDMTFRTLRRLF